MILPVPPVPRTRRLLLALMVLASLLVGSSWSVFSHTWDEPEHLAAGLSLLDRFRYEYDIQHPPLGRVAIAIGPFLLGAHSVGKPPPDGRPDGDEILYGQGHYREFLTAARAGVLPFLWLLSIVTFGFARRAGLGDRGALAAVAFLLTTPPVLGHAGLATLDVPAVATTLWATYALMRWLEDGGRRAVLHLGLAGGVAVATKLSAIPFLGLALPAVLLADLVATQRVPRLAGTGRRLLELGAAAALAFVVVTLCYGSTRHCTSCSAHAAKRTISPTSSRPRCHCRSRCSSCSAACRRSRCITRTDTCRICSARPMRRAGGTSISWRWP